MVPRKKYFTSYRQFEQIISKSTQTHLSCGLQICFSKLAYMVTTSFTSRHEQCFYTQKNTRIDDDDDDDDDDDMTYSQKYIKFYQHSIFIVIC